MIITYNTKHFSNHVEIRKDLAEPPLLDDSLVWNGIIDVRNGHIHENKRCLHVKICEPPITFYNEHSNQSTSTSNHTSQTLRHLKQIPLASDVCSNRWQRPDMTKTKDSFLW